MAMTTEPITLNLTEEMRTAALALAQCYQVTLNPPPASPSPMPQPTLENTPNALPVWTSRYGVVKDTAQTRLNNARVDLMTAAVQANPEIGADCVSRLQREKLFHDALNRLTAEVAQQNNLNIPYQGIYYGPQLGLRKSESPQIIL